MRQKLAGDEPIYVWDESSKIYLDTKAKSASQFSSPNVNTKKISHQRTLEDELLENKSVYIVVNENQKVPKAIRKVLATNYKVDRKIDAKGFVLYQKK